ncbi:hypothetical protein GCM10008994_15580 [Halorubrum ejinorense]|uniref:Uncharacterized protein n=1 Tax=Halorubrum ejinorense TaxID=425309 RepID=A0AAV3SSQ2_9EURY
MRRPATDRTTDAIRERPLTKEETQICVALCEEGRSELTPSVEQRNKRLCLAVSNNDE